MPTDVLLTKGGHNMTNYREILRLDSLGINHSQIARSTGHSRQTVVSVLKKAEQKSVGYADIKKLSDRDLARLFIEIGPAKLGYKMPDYEYVHKEMAKSGVTLGLLWVEYCEECRKSGDLPYQSTQFNKYYADFVMKTKATMHINRKPGDAMEVDWAGDTFSVVNTDTGEMITAYVFVSALSYSGYAYVEAFFSMNMESWVSAHVNAYEYYGGATRLLIPDNLKASVLSNTRIQTLLNKTYQGLAEHYGTAVLPARVAAPRDKPKVEGAVGVIETWIMAALRNGQFFTLHELNAAIREKLYEFNTRPFQKIEGSRHEKFLEEKPFLLPLPRHPFELAEWKVATVGRDYHAAYLGQYFSVPYKYIGKKVDLRVTKNIIEIYYEGLRICSHRRSDGFQGKYTTDKSHMPPNHQKYLEWNGDRFRKWAKKVGPNTLVVIEYFLSSVKVEEQSYKTCNALLHLSDKNGNERLEAACAKVLSFTIRPSFKAVQSVIKSGMVKQIESASTKTDDSAFQYGFLRGAKYYGGDDDAE
jgi:transposase